MCKTSLRKKPKERFRRECVKLPDFMGQRSIVESVNFSLKSKQITALRSKKKEMRQIEFGGYRILYNIRMNINDSISKSPQLNLNFFLLIIKIYVFPDNARKYKHLKKIA